MNTAIAMKLICMILISLGNGAVISQTINSSNHVPQPQGQRILHQDIFKDMLLTMNHTYVDKTLLLEAILDDPKLVQTSIIKTMPKRFGKSLNLLMIKAFCEIEMYNDATPVAKDPNDINDTPNYHLFTQEYVFGYLKISQKKEFVRKNLGKHPVAYFNFLGCAIPPVMDLPSAIDCCRMVIHEAFVLHRYLLNSNLPDYEKSIVRSWISYDDYHFKDEIGVAKGMKLLIDILCQQFGKPVIVLIDEYDLLVHKIIGMGDEEIDQLQGEIVFNFYTSIFVNALKFNDKLRVALFTGILHISEVGISTVLSNVVKCPFARNDRFVEYYGFTREEVEALFQRPSNKFQNLSLDAIRTYYDGYYVGEQNLYSPYSISQCLNFKSIEPYWANVGSINFIWKAFRLFRLRVFMLDLLDGKSVDIEILETINIQDIYDLKRCIHLNRIDNDENIGITVFFNFILDTGYLTINSGNKTHYNVKIPNKEIHFDLTNLLNTYKLRSRNDKDSLLEWEVANLLTKIDFVNFEDIMQEITDKMDQLYKLILPREPNYKEANLKNMMRSLLWRYSLDFSVEVAVNKTTGRYGYIDLLITSIPGIQICIEFKYWDGCSQNKTSQNALQQIDRNYLEGLLKSEHNVYQKESPYNMLLLGICVTRLKKEGVEAPWLTISAKMVTIMNGQIVDDSERTADFIGFKTLCKTPTSADSDVTNTTTVLSFATTKPSPYHQHWIDTRLVNTVSTVSSHGNITTKSNKTLLVDDVTIKPGSIKKPRRRIGY